MLAFDQKYIIYDTETEGLNLRYSRPWELSYVEAKGNKIVDKKQIYIDIPKLDIPPFVQKLTGFDQAKYDRIKVKPKEAWDMFKPFLEDDSYKLVGQNILFFDLWMLKSLARMAGDDSFKFDFMDRFLDTRFLAVAWKNGLDKPRDGDYLSWFYKLHNDASLKRRGVGQEALLKALNIPYDSARLHDGLYDVERNWEIFLEFKKILKL